MYNILFKKGQLGHLTLKNRLVMSPMGCGLANLDGTPSEDMIEYYERRAMGGAGLIIPEITRINEIHGAGLLRQLSVTKDKHIEPLSRLAQALHRHGTKLVIQLHHPGRETVSALLGGQPVVAPSAIPCKLLNQETRALSTEEIHLLVNDFIQGAIRVQKAGCDGVELHAAHGYLLHQFLSPYTNKREDEYGGSFTNRMRFLVEIIEGIRSACGPFFPIGVRLSVEEFLNKTGVTKEYIHLEDGIRIGKALEVAGIDFLDVSCGLYETGMTCIEPISFPQGWRREMLKSVKDQLHIPVIGVSVIRDPQVAEAFLQDKVVDFVSMGRSWNADPDWGRKVLEGRESELRKCVSCLRCFESLNEYNAAGQPPECSLNPEFARERQYGPLIQDTQHHQVVVVGGGPAGMCAAETLALRGIKVTVLDQQRELGGMVNLAKKPPHKERMEWIAGYYEQSLERLGVDINYDTYATEDTILSYHPDAVILATGSRPIVPKSIKGTDRDNVYTVNQILSGKKILEGKKILVVGAGLTGLETAEFLADQGNQVTIMDMTEKPAPQANHTNVADVCGRLNRMQVHFLLEHSLKEILGTGVVVENSKEQTTRILETDAVVLALGFAPDQSLFEGLISRGVPVKMVGSAVKDGAIAPAVRQGYETARTLFLKEEKQPSFRIQESEIVNFGKVSLMDQQEGVYLSYLTDPEGIRRILPPPLQPFSMPVVTLSICHVKQPSFADEYYEAILGVYATYGQNLGLYTVGLVLGGQGAEMAVQCGRDNGSIPKKLGAEFVIRKNGDKIAATVTRRGTQLVDLQMELGEYNSPLAGALYQFPAAGKKTFGGGFYFHFDRIPDENGISNFTNGALLMNQCEYQYHVWTPGAAEVKLQSSIDDPWAELPVRTVIGGGYSQNSLLVHKLNLIERLDANKIIPYLLTGRYDRTVFMETGRI